MEKIDILICILLYVLIVSLTFFYFFGIIFFGCLFLIIHLIHVYKRDNAKGENNDQQVN